MPETEDRTTETDDRTTRTDDGGPRWRAVYASALLFCVAVIVALWWFSRAFSS
jgi:hypothetical protein